MKGCRPLTGEETRVIAKSFSGIYARWKRALFIFGVRTGFRIGEMLSRRVGDVIAGPLDAINQTITREADSGRDCILSVLHAFGEGRMIEPVSMLAR